MDDNFRQIEIGHTALVGGLIIPATALWSAALCLARRRGDPSRRFTTIYKIALAIWTL